MDTVTLILPDVATEADRQQVEAALSGLDGVRRATLDLAAGWATIAFDPDRISIWDLVVAIERHGYDVGALVPAGSKHLADGRRGRDDHEPRTLAAADGPLASLRSGG